MSISNPDPVKQGDSLDLSYGTKPSQDMSDWDCRVVVKVALADISPLIDINLTDLSSDTYALIGQMDTASLSEGTYFLLAELYNATTGQRKEIHNTLTIEEQGVF